jgi:uncharacterized membrane protein YphA (DoxX/SURF4 family)
MNEIDFAHGIALLTIRMVAGVLFFFQAYDKLFRIGVRQVTEQFSSTLTIIPKQFIYLGILVSSLIELAGGVLLFSGFFITPVLGLLLIDMVVVAVMFSAIRPMWDMQYYFPRLLLLLALALLPADWDCFSLAKIF